MPNPDWWYEPPDEEKVSCRDCGTVYNAGDIPLWLKQKTRDGKHFTDDAPICENCADDYMSCGHHVESVVGDVTHYCAECEGDASCADSTA